MHTKPNNYRTPSDYAERAERSEAFAERLAQRLDALRTYYRRNPHAREALGLDALQAQHEQAEAVASAEQVEVARMRAQPYTAVRAARLQWRIAELAIARLRVEIAQVQLERAEACAIARAA